MGEKAHGFAAAQTVQIFHSVLLRDGVITILPCTGTKRNTGAVTGAKKKQRTRFRVSFVWRRRRDSNPRDPLGAYMISNHAPSTN